ncbi:MAG: DUF169 domain-containing protein, partial [Odoribacter sp.]|nr:DUF169 domain-containing protein [Odoribacter sp.]
TGFIDMPPQVPNFVSLKEKYKQTPEQVIEFVEGLDFPKTEEKYLYFERVDKINSFEGKEGLIFFATPDVLTGLVSWTLFDTNAPDAVSVPFSSGCSSTISQVVAENLKGGKRTFIGFFDPSVRPCVEANILSFSIPMTRFKEMYYTMSESALGGAHAWEKVKKRINGEV